MFFPQRDPDRLAPAVAHVKVVTMMMVMMTIMMMVMMMMIMMMVLRMMIRRRRRGSDDGEKDNEGYDGYVGGRWHQNWAHIPSGHGNWLKERELIYC